MTFKPALWRPIAFLLSAVNLVAVGFAAGSAEAGHAAVHAALALAFGLWTQRMGQRQGQVSSGSDREGRLEDLEMDVSSLRGELGEAHERLDFLERLLAQGQESRRVSPERQEGNPPI